MLYVVIAACELAFWVMLLSGLTARYVLHLPKLGAVLLACLPLVDLVLLAAAALDLHRGGTPSTAHGLAAVFLGVSVVWGRDLVHWADERFAGRRTGGRPPRVRRVGAEHARHERKEWFRHLLAWGIGCGLLLAAVALVEDPGRSQPLLAVARGWTTVLAIDFLWAFNYTLWPRTTPTGRAARADRQLNAG